VAEFVAAVERVARGGTAFDPEVVKMLVGGHRRSALDDRGPLQSGDRETALPQHPRRRTSRPGDLREARPLGHRGRQPPRACRACPARTLTENRRERCG
jgi:hypothetical protein